MNVNYFFHNKYFDYLLEDSVMNPNTSAPKWYNKLLDNEEIIIPEKANRMLNNAIVKYGEDDFILDGRKYFELKTTYPGLLIGSGNSHEVGQISGMIGGKNNERNVKKIINESVKLAIDLDYVSGLPMISASSIKGVLRSAFENYPEYVANKLYVITKEENWIGNNQKTLVELLMHKIFDSGDVFFDAVPIKGGKNNHILGMDYITSHKCEEEEAYDGLIGPNPIKMMKVIPNVVFLFSFIINESKIKINKDEELSLSVDNKLQLFQGIIEDLGIGGKTNTGFGAMETIPTESILSKEVIKILKDKKMLTIEVGKG